ncbi:hypothetical protein [uncultured Bacteroides sp.]|uniref:hypothetical protein n=1 Tax=uncultured Bacteroides sp. TaxID=162156 RepID=UPI002AA8A037|nr:hypothetical protein [uncultured Bacteroides sp.]
MTRDLFGRIKAAEMLSTLMIGMSIVPIVGPLLGSLQYGNGILSTILLALFADGTPWTMSWIIALFALASTCMALIKPRKSKNQ